MKYAVPKVRPIADGRTSGVLWKAALTSCCQFYQDLGFYCTCIKYMLKLLSLTIWFILCGTELPSSFIFERLQLAQSNADSGTLNVFSLPHSWLPVAFTLGCLVLVLGGAICGRVSFMDKYSSGVSRDG